MGTLAHQTSKPYAQPLPAAPEPYEQGGDLGDHPHNQPGAEPPGQLGRVCAQPLARNAGEQPWAPQQLSAQDDGEPFQYLPSNGAALPSRQCLGAPSCTFVPPQMKWWLMQHWQETGLRRWSRLRRRPTLWVAGPPHS